MGEEWGETRPFAFFTDFTGDLADAVREGRRREFRHFAAFDDPARRARIPDPNDPATFAASKLDWAARDTARRPRLARLRRRPARHPPPRRSSPTSPPPAGHCGSVVAAADGVIAVDWHLAGAHLRLRANLGDTPATAAARRRPPPPRHRRRRTRPPAACRRPRHGSEPMSLRATYRLQFTAGLPLRRRRRARPLPRRRSASATSTPRRSSPPARAAPTATTSPTPTGFNPELGTEADFRAMAAALPRPRPRPDPRHRAEPHGHRRRRQPLLARACWNGARPAPSPAGSTSTGTRPIPASPARCWCRSSATRTATSSPPAASTLRFDPTEGSFAVWAHDTHKLPVCPRDYGTILRAGGLDDLAAAFDAAAPLRRPIRAGRARPTLAATGPASRRARRLPRHRRRSRPLVRLDALIAAPALARRRSSPSTATPSTTAASSPSATSPASASRTRRSSTPPTRLVLAPGRRGPGRRPAHRPHRRPRSTPRPTRCACASAPPARSRCWWRRSSPPTSACPPTGRPTAPPATRSPTSLVGLLVDPAGTDALSRDLRRRSPA